MAPTTVRMNNPNDIIEGLLSIEKFDTIVGLLDEDTLDFVIGMYQIILLMTIQERLFVEF